MPSSQGAFIRTKLVKVDAKDVVLVRLSLWSVTLVKVQLTAGLVHTVRSLCPRRMFVFLLFCGWDVLISVLGQIFREEFSQFILIFLKHVRKSIILYSSMHDVTQFLLKKPPTIVIYKRFGFKKSFHLAQKAIRPLHFITIKCSYFLLTISIKDENKYYFCHETIKVAY